MIDLPMATEVHRRMPKEAFYRNLSLTNAVKEKFVSDVDRITVENSLTKENLNLTADAKAEEILLLSLSLKKKGIDRKILEEIARQNTHKLVFLLLYGDSRRLAVYRGKLYHTQWMDEAELSLKPEGFSLDEIWDSFIEQIALREERVDDPDGLSLDERLARQEKIVKLESQIAKTEAAEWRETQPKKKFELHTRLQKYRKKLDEFMLQEFIRPEGNEDG